MQVNIYVHQTIKGPGTKAGSFTYILETEIDGKVATLTKTDILEPMSENKAELNVLLQALKRLRKECDVLVVGASPYIKQGVECWLEKWVAAGWKNAKGKDVANMEEWQQFLEFSKKYHIKICGPSSHSYSYWIKNETEKKEKERQESCLKDLENLKAQAKSTKQQSTSEEKETKSQS